MLLLLACAAPTETADGDTADAGRDSTSDSAEVLAELPTLAECVGADFVPAYEWWPGNPYWYVRYAESDLFLVWLALNEASEATGCPVRVEAEDGTVGFTGPCTADGVTFAGTWTELEDPEGHLLDEVSVALPDHEPPITFTGDGTFIEEYTTEGGFHVGVMQSVDGHYAISSGSELDGEFSFSNLQVARDEGGYTASGAMEVHWPHGDGSYCPTVDLHTVAACPEEPDGFVALQGLETMIGVADGSTDCDGCVHVYVDGVLGEDVCDFPDVFY